MTESEIISAYSRAKDKRKQVDILADLSGLQKSEILRIVHDHEKAPVKEQPQEQDWKEQLLTQLYGRLDELEKEIRRKEVCYKEIATAIKVISELAG